MRVSVLIRRSARNFRVARDTSEIWAVGTMRVVAWFRQLFRLLSQPGFFVVDYFRFARHRLRTATIPASGFQRRFTEAIA
jgi:hypothetical protein